jgi:hypothetical protein
MNLILDNQNAQALRLKKLEEKVAGMNEEIKQSCNDLASVQQYIDANVAELKEFMAGVTKKLPMPLFVTTEKGKGMLGFGKKVVKLWFICPQVLQLYPCRCLSFADITVYFCTQTGFAVATETKEWQQWAKIGFGAVSAGLSAFKVIAAADVMGLVEGVGSAASMLLKAKDVITECSDNKTGIVDGIKNMYSSCKSEGEANFDKFVCEPFLTSKEHDALLEQLRKADFFSKMAYDAQSAVWVQKEWLDTQPKHEKPKLDTQPKHEKPKRASVMSKATRASMQAVRIGASADRETPATKGNLPTIGSTVSSPAHTNFADHVLTFKEYPAADLPFGNLDATDLRGFFEKHEPQEMAGEGADAFISAMLAKGQDMCRSALMSTYGELCTSCCKRITHAYTCEICEGTCKEVILCSPECSPAKCPTCAKPVFEEHYSSEFAKSTLGFAGPLQTDITCFGCTQFICAVCEATDVLGDW